MVTSPSDISPLMFPLQTFPRLVRFPRRTFARLIKFADFDDANGALNIKQLMALAFIRVPVVKTCTYVTNLFCRI